MVHHRGRGSQPAAAHAGLRGALYQPELWSRADAPGVRRPQTPALPLVLRWHPDPAQALARAAPVGASRPPGIRVGSPRPDLRATVPLSAWRLAVVRRRADLCL